MFRPGISAPGMSVPTQTRCCFGPMRVAHSVVVCVFFQTVLMPDLVMRNAADLAGERLHAVEQAVLGVGLERHIGPADGRQLVAEDNPVA